MEPLDLFAFNLLAGFLDPVVVGASLVGGWAIRSWPALAAGVVCFAAAYVIVLGRGLLSEDGANAWAALSIASLAWASLVFLFFRRRRARAASQDVNALEDR